MPARIARLPMAVKTLRAITVDLEHCVLGVKVGGDETKVVVCVVVSVKTSVEVSVVENAIVVVVVKMSVNKVSLKEKSVSVTVMVSVINTVDILLRAQKYQGLKV